MFSSYCHIKMLIILLFVLCTKVLSLPLQEEEDSLILLHVILRHGDRGPAYNEVYPNDPYNATVYFPEGPGELTKKGKEKEYKIGKTLRGKYGSFLGSFKSSEVFAMSTDYARTKMSCLLVLAGLYPPDVSQVWEKGLNWQPIPYSYNKYDSDYLLGDPIEVCPRFIKLYGEYLTREGNKIYEKDKEFYEYVSMHTGVEVNTVQQIYGLQFILNAQESIGLKLPEWTNSVWPTNISRIASDHYNLSFATIQMMRLSGGPLLKKIIDDTKEKISNATNPHKIYIYSVHEHNIAYQLMFCKAMTPHIPTYGSYLVFEIHKVNGVFGIKIYYEQYSNSSGYIKIGNCGEFCPFDRFIEFMRNNLPTPEDVCPLD